MQHVKRFIKAFLCLAGLSAPALAVFPVTSYVQISTDATTTPPFQSGNVNVNNVTANFLTATDNISAGAIYSAGNAYPTTLATPGTCLGATSNGVFGYVQCGSTTTLIGTAAPLSVFNNASGSLSIQVSSPTSAINFDSNTFTGSLQGAATAFMTAGPNMALMNKANVFSANQTFLAGPSLPASNFESSISGTSMYFYDFNNSPSLTAEMNLGPANNALFFGSTGDIFANAESGKLKVFANTEQVGNDGELDLFPSFSTYNGSYIGIKSPHSISGTTVWTWPGADGSSGQSLITNGAGTLSFATISGSSGTVGGNNIYPATSTPSFPYAFTATSATFTGSGNGQIILGIGGLPYTVVSSSVTPIVGSFAVFTSTNGTIGNGASGGGVTIPLPLDGSSQQNTTLSVTSSNNTPLQPLVQMSYTNEVSTQAVLGLSNTLSGNVLNIQAKNSANTAQVLGQDGALSINNSGSKSYALDIFSSTGVAGNAPLVYVQTSSPTFTNPMVVFESSGVGGNLLQLISPNPALDFHESDLANGVGRFKFQVVGNALNLYGRTASGASDMLDYYFGQASAGPYFMLRSTGAVRMMDLLNDHYTGIKSSSSVSANFDYVLPASSAPAGSILGSYGVGSSSTDVNLAFIPGLTVGVGVPQAGDYMLNIASSSLAGSATDYYVDTFGNSVQLGSATINSGATILAPVTAPYELAVGTTSVGGYHLNVSTNGNIYSNGPAPTISSCGSGPSGSVVGNNHRGVITVGGGSITACTMTFASGGYGVGCTVSCTESDNSATVTADFTSISATAAVFGFSASIGGGTIWYDCEGIGSCK